MRALRSIRGGRLRRANRGIGVMLVAVVVFSSSSSVVKWSQTPGPVIAFWRMLIASMAWWVVVGARRVATGRRPPSAAVWRAVLPVGLCFGANMSLFFAAINHTSIAHAEFITALSPLLLVPIGAVMFHERPNSRALPFGAVTLAGLAVVLLAASDGSGASWKGDVIIIATLFTWVGYLVAGRRARATVDVVDFMSTVMPFGLLVAAPAALVQAGGDVWPLEARGWIAVLMLAVLTGMVGHGLIAVAQRELDVGTISIIQVAQPALAVCWALLILGEPIVPLQLPGMALVLAGLAGFTVVQQRRTGGVTATVVAASGELTGSVG